MSFQIKRIYDPPARSDGARVLVDRLWPRGVSKEKAMLTEWIKDVAPSPMLREWFAHDAAYFAAFSEKYRAELDRDPVKKQAVLRLLQMGRQGTLTLLYAARDPLVNHALVLKDYLEEKAASPASGPAGAHL